MSPFLMGRGSVTSFQGAPSCGAPAARLRHRFSPISDRLLLGANGAVVAKLHLGRLDHDHPHLHGVHVEDFDVADVHGLDISDLIASCTLSGRMLRTARSVRVSMPT